MLCILSNMHHHQTYVAATTGIDTLELILTGAFLFLHDPDSSFSARLASHLCVARVIGQSSCNDADTSAAERAVGHKT